MSAPTAKPPTCRELLDAVKRGDRFSDDAGLDLAARVEAVLELHKPGRVPAKNYEVCTACGDDVPCATERLLNGEPA